MDENFKNACEIVIGEAIIKIGNMPEYEKCSIIDIKKGLAEVLKRYIEIEAKNMSLEDNIDMYDLNNNIKIFTNYKSKEFKYKDNGHKYICALIPNSCFNTSGNYREPMRLRYLLTEQEYLNLVTDYTFGDKISIYFTSGSVKKASLFEENEIEEISENLFNNEDYKYMYSLLKIDASLYPIESVLNKKYVLYHFNNGTINEVEDMYFYVKDFITNIDIDIFYDELKKDSCFKTTKVKKEAKPISFEKALLLLVALRKLDPEIEWHMEEY